MRFKAVQNHGYGYGCESLAMIVWFQVMGELGWDHFRIRSWVAQLKGKNKIKKKMENLSFS